MTTNHFLDTFYSFLPRNTSSVMRNSIHLGIIDNIVAMKKFITFPLTKEGT